MPRTKNLILHFALILVLLLLTIIQVYSQSCIPGWKYRMEIEIQNNNSDLKDFQAKLVINTTDFVGNGKMQDDGDDIRFMDVNNNSLPYWIQPGTFNTDHTTIWIKTKDIPAGSSSLYMYYGNTDAVGGTSGEATFLFFDDFSGSFNKWSQCGGDAYLSDGKLKLETSISDNYKGLLKSNLSFVEPYVSAMKVSNMHNKTDIHAGICQLNEEENGYGLISAQSNTDRFMVIDKYTSSSDGCFNNQQLPGEAIANNGYSGVWDFSWFAPNQQNGRLINNFYDYDVNRLTSDDSFTQPGNLFSGILIYGGEGSITIDWFYARKKAADLITLNIKSESETELPNAASLNAGSNSPLCEGEELFLYSDEIEGATYKWFNTEGTLINTGRTHNINMIDSDDAGEYHLVVEPATGTCNKIIEKVNVNISPTPQAGTIEGARSVCHGSNNGFLELKNYTGKIDHWEYSITGSDPWAVINNKASRQNYSNLSQTTYYRTVVKSGICGTEISGAATIQVDSLTNAGSAKGNTSICFGNSTIISLENFTGNIDKWEKSYDLTTWSKTTKTGSTFQTDNLTDTTYYRAIVTSGCCQSDTSNIVTINVNPPSQGGTLEFDTVCSGSTGELVLSNYTGRTIRWESSQNGKKPWTSIHNTKKTMIYEDVNESIFYRVIVQNNGCDNAISSIGGVIVDKTPKGNKITNNTSVCADNNEGQIIIENYEGNIEYWESSVDSGNSWYLFDSEAKDTVTYYNIKKETWFRAHLKSKYNECNSTYSEVSKVFTDQLTLGGIVKNKKTVCENRNKDTIRLTNYRGDIIRWEKSTTGGTPWDVISHKSDSLIYENLKETTYYRAIVKNNSCSEKKSEKVKIAVDVHSDAGQITGITSHCAQNNQGSLTLTDEIGKVLKWEKSSNKSTWEMAPNQHPNLLEYKNINDTTFYRAIVQNGVCSQDTSEPARIAINPLPKVDFSSDTAELGKLTHFSNKSTVESGVIINYEWDFDNGYGSNAKDPVYEFPKAGSYFVCLKARTDKGCTDSTKKNVEVLPKPNTDFSFNNICAGDTVHFTNETTIPFGNVSYFWDFGDNNYTNTPNPFHVYNQYGSFRVKLIATTDEGVKDSIIHVVEVYPHANLNFSFQNVCKNETITFINESEIPEGSMSYFWNLGDSQTTTNLNPSHKYTEYGEYPITLSATTDHNCKDTLVKQIRVHPNPIADFIVEDVPYMTHSVFNDQSSISNGLIKEWIWDFGDGNRSEEQNPYYLYPVPGAYLASLTVVSDSGCMNSIAKNIKVYPLPEAKFKANDVCDKDSVHFYNESTISAGSLNYQWAFGDGNTSQKVKPSHIYSQPGTYEVTLIAISEEQGKDTLQKQITVYPNPKTEFNVSEVCDGHPSNFINQTTIESGAINSFTWDFGDGTNSIQRNPVKQYLNPGTYEVSLTANSEKGCKNNIVHSTIVRKNPVADFEFEDVCLGNAVKIWNQSIEKEGNLSFFWEFGDGSTTVLAEPQHNYSVPGSYLIKLYATSSYNCKDSLFRYINIYSLPEVKAGEDTTTSRGFPVELKGSGAVFYDWSPAGSLDNPGLHNPLARPMRTTTYILRGEDEHGCENMDSVTVKIKEDYKVIPNNIITPDNNGINDTWEVTNIDAYEKASIYIFNRWGEEVFQKSGYLNEWDGRNNNGDILPDGTYYYIIRFSNSKQHYSGSITLLRNKN